jgi:hypothetical protein
MKSKNYFIMSLLLIFLALVLFFVGVPRENPLVIGVSIIILFLGIASLIKWSTVAYTWTCSECGESFKISFLQSLKGRNGGRNCKQLLCPKCNERVWCKAIRI